MTHEATACGQAVSDLRRAFDLAFAEAPSTEQIGFDDFLAIRAGGEAYAIRMAEIAGLFANRSITRLPMTLPAFCGVAGFRGTILPVYDLCTLLGGIGTAGTPRWLVIARSLPVGLVFDGLEGHLRLPRVAGTDDTLREVLNVDGCARPIIRLASVCEAIRKGVPPGARS